MNADKLDGDWTGSRGHVIVMSGKLHQPDVLPDMSQVQIRSRTGGRGTHLFWITLLELLEDDCPAPFLTMPGTHAIHH